jgi:hypothetical protein
MPVFKLEPSDIRVNDAKWAASNLKEAVWVEARDDLDARHLIEVATLRMQDFQPDKKLLFSPWLDDVVTPCQLDKDPGRPPDGHLSASLPAMMLAGSA